MVQRKYQNEKCHGIPIEKKIFVISLMRFILGILKMFGRKSITKLVELQDFTF